MIYIYGLIDPRNNRMFYVGQSVEPNKRLRNHISEAKNNKNENPHKERVIKSVLRDSLEPEIKILFSHENQDVINRAEMHFIKNTSGLTNIHPGGNLPPRLSGEKNPFYKGKLPQKKCLFCAQEFEVSCHVESRVKRTKFCSRKCQINYGRELVTCRGCGIEFSKEKFRKGKYCSSFCYNNNSNLYLIISPSKECYLITNLNDFCKIHNLKQAGMTKIFNKKLPYSKTYKKWSGIKVI